MLRNTIRFASLAPVLASLAVGPIVQQTLAVTALVSLSSRAAVAAPTIRMNAQGMLQDMRASLGEMAFAFSEEKGANRRRSAVAVLAALTEATRSVQTLDVAIASRKPSRISVATKALSRAVGDLQTRYSLSSARPKEATRALTRFNAAWKEYSCRFVLSKHGKVGANSLDARAVRREVASLSSRMQVLQNDVADNTALRTEVARLQHEIAMAERAPAGGYDYQRLSFTLTVLSGSFAALEVSTREYYPAYYARIANFERGPAIESYWDGYYDGYYRGLADGYFSEPATITEPVLTEMRTEINVSYETIYNVTNETTNIYQTMDEEDLSDAAVAPVPETVNFSVDDVYKSQTLSSFSEKTSGNADLPSATDALDEAIGRQASHNPRDPTGEASGDEDNAIPTVLSTSEQDRDAVDSGASTSEVGAVQDEDEKQTEPDTNPPSDQRPFSDADTPSDHAAAPGAGGETPDDEAVVKIHP